MSNRKLIENELEAVKNDREVGMTLVKKGQENMSSDLSRVPRQVLAYRPRTFKKSVKMRFSERMGDFINRLKTVFGI